MFCLINSSKVSRKYLNFHWRWRWWDQIQAIFLGDLYFSILNKPDVDEKIKPSKLRLHRFQQRIPNYVCIKFHEFLTDVIVLTEKTWQQMNKKDSFWLSSEKKIKVFVRSGELMGGIE